MFDLRQLRYFVAVANTLSFTRAAERLHISQPPLSQQIRALEDDLGVRLFDRNRRRVALTEPGRLFLDEARKILAQVDAARVTASEAAAGHHGRLRLAYPVSLSFHRALPEALLRFSTACPDVRVELSEMYTEAQYAALLAGQIDVGLVRARPKAKQVCAQVVVDVVDEELLLLALPSSHPLAKRKHVRMRELAGERFVTQPHSCGTTLYDALVRLAAAAGFRPFIQQEVQQVTGMLAMVSAGVGMALVPASLQAVQLPGVAMVALADPHADIILAVARRKEEPSPVLARFLESVQDSLESAGAQTRSAS